MRRDYSSGNRKINCGLFFPQWT